MKRGVFLVFALALALALALMSGCAPIPAGVADSPIEPPGSPVEPPAPVAPGDVPALPEFLEMLAGPAGWVALGVFLSALLARWPWFSALPGDVKSLVVPAASALLSIGARSLLMFVHEDVWTGLAPFWFIVAGTVGVWLSSQGRFFLMRSVSDSREVVRLMDGALPLPHEE